MTVKAHKALSIASIGVPVGVVVFVLQAVIAMTTKYDDLRHQDDMLATTLYETAERLNAVDARSVELAISNNELKIQYADLEARVAKLDARGSTALMAVTTDLARLRESYQTELSHIYASLAEIKTMLKEMLTQ